MISDMQSIKWSVDKGGELLGNPGVLCVPPANRSVSVFINTGGRVQFREKLLKGCFEHSLSHSLSLRQCFCEARNHKVRKDL